MDSVQSTADEMLAECETDAIGLWVILGRLASSGVAAAMIRDATLSVIRRLLLSGRVVVGQYAERGFVRWELAPDESVQRVSEEWRSLGRDPIPGEICWMLGRELHSRQHTESQS